MNEQQEKDLFFSLLQKYGEKAQIIKSIEEMSELIKELCKITYAEHRFSYLQQERVRNEIVDVDIMLSQLKEIYFKETEFPTQRSLVLHKIKQRLLP